MRSEDRENVAAAIAKNSRRVSLRELAADGKRHVHLITAREALRAIESIVDESISRHASEIGSGDRASLLRELRHKLDDDRRDLEQRNEARLEELEKRVKEEIGAIRSSLQSIEQRASSVNTSLARELLEELERREESRRADLEARLGAALSSTVDQIRRTVVAALCGTEGFSSEATDLVVASVFDSASAVESNVASLGGEESQAGGGIDESLARLRALRQNKAASEKDEQQSPS